MNKKELIAAIADSSDITKRMASRALDSLLAGMVGAMERGERVILSGFGSFRVVERGEQQGRNPQTGALIVIPAHYIVKFRPGKTLVGKVKCAEEQQS